MKDSFDDFKYLGTQKVLTRSSIVFTCHSKRLEMLIAWQWVGIGTLAAAFVVRNFCVLHNLTAKKVREICLEGDTGFSVCTGMCL